MSLSDKALLVSLNISQWQARKFDRKVTSDVAYTEGVNPNAGRYNKALLPGESLLMEIHAKTSAVRKWFYTETVPWSIEGTQLLKTTNYMNFTAEFRKHKSEWGTLVDRFVGEYPRLVSEARANLKGLFNEADYPAYGGIAERFRMGVSVMPVPNDSFWAELGDQELEEVKQGVRQQVEAAQRDAMKEVWARFEERVQLVADKLSDPTAIFKDSLITNTQEMCNLLKRLNITDDPELEAMRSRVEYTLAKANPDMLRLDPHYRRDAAAEAKAILDKMGIKW